MNGEVNGNRRERKAGFWNMSQSEKLWAKLSLNCEQPDANRRGA